MKVKLIISFVALSLLGACKESEQAVNSLDPGKPGSYQLLEAFVDKSHGMLDYRDINIKPKLRFKFTSPIDKSSVLAAVIFNSSSSTIGFDFSLENGDSTIAIEPVSSLANLTKHFVNVSTSLKGKKGETLKSAVNLTFTTALDTTDKFPRVSDEALLDLVQKQTFKYFWDFGHPVSGLARERNTSGDVVTSGGSGFGMMTIPVAIERKFITRAQGLERMQKMVGFLKNKTQKFHGAFPHWLNGATGAVVPFSTKDNGADLVETAYLVQGLLTARQYFNSEEVTETALRNDINTVWLGVEWNWFQKDKQNVLYWHWSPEYNWDMNHEIKGWNECLITYILAASSPTHASTKSVYDNGWTSGGSFVNGKQFYGIKLPLGEDYGGPLFFSQYSFLGLNPTNLTDRYANYFTQNTSHTLINFNYCKTNLKSHSGYSEQCWGLTASDIPNGYNASSPTNDKGVISPTAALSAFPYTPDESMKALKFFYYKLGDRIWGEYGFRDAFSLDQLWFADSYLAIDQGPIVIMIENKRSRLLWNLFMSSPEVKSGLKNLNFESPNLKFSTKQNR